MKEGRNRGMEEGGWKDRREEKRKIEKKADSMRE